MANFNRPRGVFTSTDREYLREGIEYGKRQTASKRRKAIRERAYHALLDGRFLFDDLPPDARRRIFDPRRDPRAPPRTAVRDFEEMGRSDGETPAELMHFENAVVRWLAFLYIGVDDRVNEVPNAASFQDLLKDALVHVVEQQGWILDEFNLILDIQRDVPTATLAERFEAEEDLTDAELTHLFQANEITGDELLDRLAS